MRIDKIDWILKIAIPALLVLPFYNCRSHSNPLANVFIKNDSFSDRARFAFDELTTFYSNITEKAGKNSDATRKADTVYHAVQNLVSLTDKAIALLEEKDASGYDTLVFRRLLSNTHLGDSIKLSVANISGACDFAFNVQDKPLTSDGVVATAEQLLQNVGLDQWNNPPYHRVPIVSTLGMLKLTCTMVAIQALANINYSVDPSSLPTDAGGK